MHSDTRKPSVAFVGASWAALLLGMGAYLIGLWNADMALNERGYYFTLLLYGFMGPFAAAMRTLTTVVNNKLEVQDTRREAAFAIGAIGSPSSVTLLETLAKSDDPYLAEISREALLKIRKH